MYGGAFTFALRGVHTLTFWSTDHAGNVEDKAAAGNTITIRVDDLPPSITGSRTPGRQRLRLEQRDRDGEVHLLRRRVGHRDVRGSDAAGERGCRTDRSPATRPTSPATGGRHRRARQHRHDEAHARRRRDDLRERAGWYTGDVTIAWSGRRRASRASTRRRQPADSTITGEGATSAPGRSASPTRPATATSASVSGIKIDRTRPAITGARRPAPNAAGWYRSAVTRRRFTCTDSLSGRGEVPDDKVLSGDGANQSVTSGAAPRHGRQRAAPARPSPASTSTARRRTTHGQQPVHDAERLVHRRHRDGRADRRPTSRASRASRRSTTAIDGGAEQTATGASNDRQRPARRDRRGHRQLLRSRQRRQRRADQQRSHSSGTTSRRP